MEQSGKRILERTVRNIMTEAQDDWGTLEKSIQGLLDQVQMLIDEKEAFRNLASALALKHLSNPMIDNATQRLLDSWEHTVRLYEHKGNSHDA